MFREQFYSDAGVISGRCAFAGCLQNPFVLSVMIAYFPGDGIVQSC